MLDFIIIPHFVGEKTEARKIKWLAQYHISSK